tara:strand:- start:203 stop:637 length:435 start_codon:yes stop_codon:yes gene_type:complete
MIFNFIKKVYGSTKRKYIKQISGKLIETLRHFDILKSRKNVLYVLITSAFVWFFALSSSYFIVKHFIDISYFVAVIGFCFAMLTYVLPLQGFLGFGTTEGAWALVLIFFGFSNEQAIATGFAFHIISLLYTSVLGLWGIYQKRN